MTFRTGTTSNSALCYFSKMKQLPLIKNDELTLTPKQFWLLKYKNPLDEKFGRDFFRSIPRTPGIYLMLGKEGDLLYVGKAKDLRARLTSYRRANTETASRKVLRLLHFVQEIRWELQETETSALLRENELLRQFKPPYNVINVNPETYTFIKLGWNSKKTELTLSMTMDETKESDFTYGAFKGRRTTLDGYRALLRLLWASHAEIPKRFEFPPVLMREKQLNEYRLELLDSDRWISLIRRFLNGTSSTLLVELTELLLKREEIPAFVYAVIQEDLESLAYFFDHGPRRNKKIRQRFKLGAAPIAQIRFDDYLVLMRSPMFEE